MSSLLVGGAIEDTFGLINPRLNKIYSQVNRSLHTHSAHRQDSTFWFVLQLYCPWFARCLSSVLQFHFTNNIANKIFKPSLATTTSALTNSWTMVRQEEVPPPPPPPNNLSRSNPDLVQVDHLYFIANKIIQIERNFLKRIFVWKREWKLISFSPDSRFAVLNSWDCFIVQREGNSPPAFYFRCSYFSICLTQRFLMNGQTIVFFFFLNRRKKLNFSFVQIPTIGPTTFL